MSELRDPPRLLDDPGGLPDGLRVAWRALPSPGQTQIVVDGVGHTLLQKAGIVPKALGAKALLAKWVGIAALGALCTYGLMQGNARVAQPRAHHSDADAVSTADIPRQSLQAVASAAPSRQPTPTIRTLAERDSGSAMDGDPGAARGGAPEPIDAERKASHTMRPRGVKGLAGASRSPQKTTSLTHPARARAGVAPAEHDDTQTAGEPEPDDELALIRAAQAALARHPARALGLLQRHALLLPRGAFAEERDVLMLDALHALGRRAELVAQARTFLHTFPGSMHKERVRGYLAPEGL